MEDIVYFAILGPNSTKTKDILDSLEFNEISNPDHPEYYASVTTLTSEQLSECIGYDAKDKPLVKLENQINKLHIAPTKVIVYTGTYGNAIPDAIFIFVESSPDMYDIVKEYKEYYKKLSILHNKTISYAIAYGVLTDYIADESKFEEEDLSVLRKYNL